LYLQDGDTYTDSTLNRRHHRWLAHRPKK
jgi:hypothetical protein